MQYRSEMTGISPCLQVSHGRPLRFRAKSVCTLLTTKLSSSKSFSFSKLKAREPDAGEMSKSDIQSWIAGSGRPTSDEETDFIWKRDRVLNDWDRSLEYAQTRLLTDRTKTRIEFLREEILGLAKHAGMPCVLSTERGTEFRVLELSLSQILDIFRLLTLTYPKYVDNSSRDAVEEVGMELVRRDELREEGKLGVTEQILGWLSNEVGGLVKRGTAK